MVILLKTGPDVVDGRIMAVKGVAHPTETEEMGDPRMLARLMDELPDAVILIGDEGRVHWANRSAEQLFGRSLEDWVGQSGLELVHPDDVEMALLSLTSVQGKKTGTPIEIRLRSAKGWRLMELVGSPVGWIGDGVVLLSIRDLTERRRYELAHDQDARARAIIHNAAAITMLVTAGGRVESVSGAMTRLLGYDPELVEGAPLADLVPEADRPKVKAALERALLGAHVASPTTVTTSFRRQGTARWTPFELTIVNLVDDPTVRGFVVSGHDVTDRTRAEEELQTTLSLLTSTLDATADGILVVDDAGRFRSFNNRFAEMWGIPESVLELGHDGSALMHVQDQLSDPAAFLARVEELYAHPEAESHDILEFTDGRVFERYSRPQTVDGAVVGRVWSFRDVTDRKQLESRLSYQAFHDSLTGLGNRALFIDRLRHAVDRSERNGGDLAVLFLDMDNVKAVNDTLGHVAGDSLLQRMAEVLQRCLRKGDTAARLGGDEFGIVAEELAGPDEAVKLAERILVASRRQLGVAGLDVRSTVSIGVTFADAGLTGEQLLSNADLAMYAAKESGKDRYAIYDPGLHGAGRIN